MHRFTEPTPPSLSGLDVVPVLVDSWEIECCAPPPVVGEVSSWHLQFVAAAPGDVAEADRESDWLLEDRGESGFVLVRGGVTAYWSTANGPAPAPGPVHVYGYLSGTAHGGIVPDDIPRVTGVVQRIHVVTQRVALRAEGGGTVIATVPGTTVLTEVAESPRRFRSDVPAPGEVREWEVGVLVDLGVPRSP